MLFKLGAPVACSILAVAATTMPSSAAVTSTVGDWQMDEGSGASVMTDSSGNGIDGQVGTAVQTGYKALGETAYHWDKVNPNEPPAKPERLVTVDDDALNPESGDYAVTIRLRTTHNYGNVFQKGQAGNKGGYFKMQNVKGKFTCRFRGTDASGTLISKSVNSGTTPLNDNAWHTIRCVRTADTLEMWVDSATKPRRARGATGNISNKVPLTIGGKPNCDQIKVTCDYWSGDIDYMKIEKG